MAYSSLDELARRLAQRLVDDHSTLCRQLLRLLAEHAQPISLEALATTLHVPIEEAAATVRKIPDLEFDAAGHLVGMGLSLLPTPYQFFLGERRMFTWCAFDTLIYPVLLGREARIESRCLVTGTSIRLLVTPLRLASLDPAEAVLSLPIPETVAGCDRNGFCEQAHFFCSHQVASTFLATHPNILLFSVADAYLLGQKYLKYKQARLEALKEQTETKEEQA